MVRSKNQTENGAGNYAYEALEAQLKELETLYGQENANAAAFDKEMQKHADEVATANAAYELAVSAVDRMTQAANTASSSLSAVGSTGMTSGQYYNWFYGRANGSHANGLDYVPFDNYLARLHTGESVLSAQESKVWRSFRSGGMDYDRLGSVMRDSGGGNVYLDGQSVGRIISGRQGDSYRALERSGWRG